MVDLGDARTPPSEGDISQAREYLQRRWNNAHQAFDSVDAHYHTENSVWEPGSRRAQFKAPYAQEIIDNASDQALAITPKFHREPVGRGEPHVEDATSVELGLSSLFYDSALKETYLPWREANSYLMGYGYVVVEAPIYMPDQGGLTSQGNPFRIQVPHPATVLLDPDEKSPTVALKLTKMTVGELVALSKRKVEQGRKFASVYEPERGHGEDANPFALVDTWDFYDERWHVKMLASGGVIYSEPNPAGFIPFVHAFSGWGLRPRDGNGDPVYQARGMLTPAVQRTIQIKQQGDSARQEVLMRYAYSARRISRQQDAEEVAQAEAQQGFVYGDQDEFGDTNPKELPRWLYQQDSLTDDILERSTLARRLGGMREQGVDTVGQQAILDTSAGRRFTAPEIQMEHLASVVAQRMLYLIDVVPQLTGGVWAQGHKITRSMIHENYDVQVAFDDREFVASMQERSMALSELSSGAIDLKTYYERVGYENGNEILRGTIKDRIRRHPRVEEKIAQQVAAEMGVGDAFGEGEGLPPGPGMAAGGGAGPPGAGVMPPDAGEAASLEGRALTPEALEPRQLRLGGG